MAIELSMTISLREMVYSNPKCQLIISCHLLYCYRRPCLRGLDTLGSVYPESRYFMLMLLGVSTATLLPSLYKY